MVIEAYDHVKTVDLVEVPITGLDDLEQLLRLLAQRPDCCVVRGAIADAKRTKGVRRLLHPDPDTGDAATLREWPRRWVALDFDGLQRPEWIEPVDLVGCAAVAIETLPDEFQGACFVVQATASQGIKPGIRIRLWAWLSRPTSGNELKWWLRTAPVDQSAFSAVQLIYTACPIFSPGAKDPIPERLEVVPGEAVVVPPPSGVLKPSGWGRRSHRASAGTAAGLIGVVSQAEVGNRNRALYWASRRMAEKIARGEMTRAQALGLLQGTASQIGLPMGEAAATVESGLKHG
jgi:hypothetical protein